MSCVIKDVFQLGKFISVLVFFALVCNYNVACFILFSRDDFLNAKIQVVLRHIIATLQYEI